MPVVIFCFRRDLRLHDNLGLQALLQRAAEADPTSPINMYPVFCLDPRQIDSSKNDYRSDNAVRFMFESLVDLDNDIRTEASRGARRHRGSHAHCKGEAAPTGTAVTGLTVLYGTPETVLPELVRAAMSEHTTTTCYVGWNEDVTPFSRARDEALTKQLLALNRRRASIAPVVVDILAHSDDHTVVPIRDLQTSTGTVYKVFTPFLRKARAQGVREPVRWASSGIARRCCWRTLLARVASGTGVAQRVVPVQTLFTDPRFGNVSGGGVVVRGGRQEGLQRLRATYLQRRCTAYPTARNLPGEERTTRLSAYLKFGCVSFREAHLAITTALHAHPKAAEALTRELFWNAFYAYITLHFPHVLGGQTRGVGSRARNMEMHKRLHGHNMADALWVTAVSRSITTRRAFQRWTSGTTGFPFVDAAMRQLTQTGWMHNRARMVVASFLTKDLRIDWREGERYFAKHLVDYDPSANNGGWQWAASTGADAQPYFRIFNPWLQSATHDRKAVYIKRFVPELTPVDPKDIHRWHVPDIRRKYAAHTGVCEYPAPMVDHSGIREVVLDGWKRMMGS